jgi:hypothetical protein
MKPLKGSDYTLRLQMTPTAQITGGVQESYFGEVSNLSQRISADIFNAYSMSETVKTDELFADYANLWVKDLPVSSDDALTWENLLRICVSHAHRGTLEHVNEILQKDAVQQFSEFKLKIKEQPATETQYLIARQLNRIEALTKEFPLVSAKQAVYLLGDLSATNPSRVINTAKQANRLFAFNFGDSKSTQVPVFQFDPEKLGVYKPVPELCRILDGLNDWGVYQWLTTTHDDLGCSPANALSRPEMEADLLFLAGLFKSDSTLRELSYTADNSLGAGESDV